MSFFVAKNFYSKHKPYTIRAVAAASQAAAKVAELLPPPDVDSDDEDLQDLELQLGLEPDGEYAAKVQAALAMYK